MTKTITTICIALAASAALCAQNFNPQVEVTNTYQGKVSESMKQDVPMAVPDSLLNFNYELDYTVFDHPYRGSYEFHPYLIEMAPEARQVDKRRLYVSLGAGYTFAPEADIVFSPDFGRGLTGSIYDTFRGYFGPMRAFKGEKTFDGRLYRNTLGLAGEISAPKTTVDVGLDYGRLFAKDGYLTHNMDKVGVRGGFKALPVLSGMSLDAEGRLSYANDNFGLSGVRDGISEVLAELDGELSSPAGRSGVVALEAGLRTAFHGGLLDNTGINLFFIPKYRISNDYASLSAGVKLSLLPGRYGSHKDYAYRSATVFPDVHGHVFIYKDKLRLFADITGGDRLNTLGSILERNPFSQPAPVYGASSGLVASLDASAERINAVAGLDGSIARCLQYRVWGGFVVAENELVDSYSASGLAYAWPAYENFNYSVAGARVDYQSDRLEAAAELSYRHTVGLDYGLPEAPLGIVVRTRYNWNNRIYAGLYCGHASVRKSSDSLYKIPSYTDLGIFGEYVLRHNLSVWLRADNLLAQDIWQYALHARTGVNITAGICLNIR